MTTKTQTTHTPGPWTVEGEAVYASRDARSRHRNGRACVANVCTGDYDELDAEGHANARLIAAAPDLLDACKNIVAACELTEDAYYDAIDTAMNIARAAIAKAEGTA